MKTVLSVIFFLGLSVSVSYGQIVRESEILRRMDRGKDLMNAGKYDSAQIDFIFVLENNEKLQSDMAYYVGGNS